MTNSEYADIAATIAEHANYVKTDIEEDGIGEANNAYIDSIIRLGKQLQDAQRAA